MSQNDVTSFEEKLNQALIYLALAEDKVQEDVTTNALLHADKIVNARVTAKAPGFISGTEIFIAVMHTVDKELLLSVLKEDGSWVNTGDLVIEMSGKESSILRGERTALNFLQRLSGIATLTGQYVEKLAGTGITLLDTRKTTPGMRYLEKKAVRDGGGTNHRMNLEDMAMIKDNHIKMAGNITAAVKAVRQHCPHKKIEVEVTNLIELKEALAMHVEMIMLDNFDLPLLKEAITITKGQAKLEVSGNVDLQNIENRAPKGIDYISVGALTHSFKSLDLSLNIDDHV